MNRRSQINQGLVATVPVGGTKGQVLTKKTNADNDVEWGANGSVPAGGTTGQALKKKSNTDGDVEWGTVEGSVPSGGTTGQTLTKKSGTDGDVEWKTPLSLGETNSTAYAGNKGKTAYDHSQDVNKSSVTAAGFYKVGATAEGHVTGLTAVTKSDVIALGLNASDVGALPSSTDIPTKTSDLTNDGSAGTSTYVEASTLSTYALKSELPGVATENIAGLVKPDGTTTTVDANGVITSTADINPEVLAEIENEIDVVDLAIPNLVEYTEEELYELVWEELDISPKQEYTEAELDEIIASIDFSGGSSVRNAYTTVKVGVTNIVASGSDTLELVAGSNVTLTPNTANKTVTITSSAGSADTEMSAEKVLQIWNSVINPT